MSAEILSVSLEDYSVEIEVLPEERKTLEEDLQSLLAVEQQCTWAAKQSTGSNICGRAVPYVGGQSSHLVRHYRQLVELYGGEFLDHDGGRQNSPTRLQALLSKADVVCCPLDCVSHDATTHIKRNYARWQKAHHFIRSSGLSSFAKALGNLATSETINTNRRFGICLHEPAFR